MNCALRTLTKCWRVCTWGDRHQLRWIQKGVLYGAKKGQNRNLLLPWQFLKTYLKEVEQDKTSSQPVIDRKNAVNHLEFDTRFFGTSLSTIQLSKWYTSRFLLNCTLERSVSILWAIKMNQHYVEAVGRHFAKQHNLLRHQFAVKWSIIDMKITLFLPRCFTTRRRVICYNDRETDLHLVAFSFFFSYVRPR